MSATRQQASSRKRAYLVLLAGTVVLSSATSAALAGQLLYTPVNPSFGGNPLNGPNLLNSAQAQKRFSMPMDGLPKFDNAVIAQTDNTLIFQRGDKYFAYSIDTGVLRQIDFNQFETSVPQ